MIKLILFSGLIFIFHSNVYSQTIPDSTLSKVKGIIKIYPLQLVGGEIRFAFERPLKKKISWEGDASYIFRIYSFQEYPGGDGGRLEIPEYKAQGFGIRNGLKYYTTKKNTHEGFYLNPLFLFKHYNHTDQFINSDGGADYVSHVNILCLQALIGYKFATKDKFSFDIYGGEGYRQLFIHTSYFGNYPPDSYTTSFFSMQFGITVGYKILGK